MEYKFEPSEELNDHSKKIHDHVMELSRKMIEDIDRLLNNWLTDKLTHFYPEIRYIKDSWLPFITENFNLQRIDNLLYDKQMIIYRLVDKHGEFISQFSYYIDYINSEIKYAITDKP